MNNEVNYISSKFQGGLDFSVYIEKACVLFYDWTDKHLFNIKNLKLESNSRFCTTQNEHIIIPYQYASIEFNSEGSPESCNDYDGLINLLNIHNHAIIIHNKYIHRLDIEGNLSKQLDFVPKNKLKIKINQVLSSKDNKGLIKYLKNLFISKIFAEVTFYNLES